MNIIIDRDAALERLDGDAELLQELVQIFFEELPGLMVAIQTAVTQQQAGALRQAAHSLKGSAGNLSATGVFEAAQRLELMARDGDLTDSAAASAVLQDEVERLKTTLATLH